LGVTPGKPYGQYAGLGLIAPGHTLTWTCEVKSAFERRIDRPGAPSLLGAVSRVLQSEALLQQFPDLAKQPRPNANFLFDLHWPLSTAPAYDLLAPDIQIGAIATLHRTRWRRTRAINKTLDAMATAALRLIPKLDREALQRALTSSDPPAITAVFREAAFQLEYDREPGKALPRSTQIGYLRDCCRLLGHPEWVEATASTSALGQGTAIGKSPTSALPKTLTRLCLRPASCTEATERDPVFRPYTPWRLSSPSRVWRKFLSMA
jgi:hypothetical protein